jgi:hypothetical protein
VSDIFNEIDEDLRAERAKKLLQRYGGLLVAAVVLAVAGVGGFQAWKYYEAKQTTRIADTFIAAMRQADGPAGPGRQAALAGFAAVAAGNNAGYRTLARLREAALMADSGQLPGALALYDAIAADGSVDRLLRDLASLEWAMHQVDSGDPALVAARLGPLAAPDNPWHALAQEEQALLALRQGNKAAARDLLNRLAQDVTAPDGLRGRANALLARLGDPVGS